MGTMPVSPDLIEQLRRQRLAQGMNNISPQATPVQQTPMALPTNAPRDFASSDYQNALNQPPPSAGDYHPSTGRKILGTVLGAIAGAHDPSSGYNTGRSFVYGPLDQKMSDYQQNLLRKKSAFEAEEKSAEDTGKIDAETERAKAEKARAGAEGARESGEKFKVSPEGQDFELKKLQIEHPGISAQDFEPYTLELNNGEKLNVSYNKRTGMYTDPITGIKVDKDSSTIKNATKSGTANQNTPKSETGKPPTLGSFGDYLIKYAHNQKPEKDPKDLSVEDVDAAKTEFNRAAAVGSETPALHTLRSSGSQRDQSAPVQASFNKFSDVLDKDAKPVNDSLSRIDKLEETLKQGTAEGDAVVFPELMAAAVGGAGSNFRMTQPEINAAVGGRTVWETLRASLNKYSSDPQHFQIPPEQRQAISKLMSAMKTKLKSQQDLNNSYYKKLADSQDPNEHRQIMSKYRDEKSKLDEIKDSPVKESSSDTTKATHKWNPQTGKIEVIPDAK